MVITGGSGSGHTAVSVYSVNGWEHDLPSLNIGRYWHACAGFISSGKKVRSFYDDVGFTAVLFLLFNRTKVKELKDWNGAFWLRQEPKERQCRVSVGPSVTLFKRTLKMTSRELKQASK